MLLEKLSIKTKRIKTLSMVIVDRAISNVTAKCFEFRKLIISAIGLSNASLSTLIRLVNKLDPGLERSKPSKLVTNKRMKTVERT